MNDALKILGWEVRGFLLLLAAMLAYRMLTGRISLRGLLARKDGSEQQVSPERVQLLVATLAVSFQFIGASLQSTNGTMPDIGAPALFVLGGSSGIYAAAKAFTSLKSK